MARKDEWDAIRDDRFDRWLFRCVQLLIVLAFLVLAVGAILFVSA